MFDNTKIRSSSPVPIKTYEPMKTMNNFNNSKHQKKDKELQTMFSELNNMAISNGQKHMQNWNKNGQINRQFSTLRKLNKSVDNSDINIIV